MDKIIEKDEDNNTMFGLGSVKVQKSDMIKKLKANRKKHKTEYNEALAEYKNCYIEKLIEVKTKLEESVTRMDAVIEIENLDVKSLPPLNFGFTLHIPSHHLECYDSTLDMVEASVHDFIILSANEFNKFYRDNWEWKGDFSSTVHHYKDTAFLRSVKRK